MAHRRKRRRKNTNTTEIQYEGSSVYVKELKMLIKLKKGRTIQDWIKNYCGHDRQKIMYLYPAYNIPLKTK